MVRNEEGEREDTDYDPHNPSRPEHRSYAKVREHLMQQQGAQQPEHSQVQG